MEEKVKCRCGTGNYCHKHKAYRLPKEKMEREERRGALMTMIPRTKKITRLEEA